MSQKSFKHIVNMFAYIAVVVIAVCLLVQLILGRDRAAAFDALRLVGEIIAYIVAGIYGFYFIKNKKNPVWAIIYAVAITAIIILLIFR